MGCCSSRNQEFFDTNKITIKKFLTLSRLNCLLCSDIKRLDAQLLSEVVDSKAFEMFSKGWSIKVPFNFFAVGKLIQKFEFKLGFLLFSTDTLLNKKSLFLEMIAGDERRFVRFLEWRYRVINEKIPQELERIKFIDNEAATNWITCGRLEAGYDISTKTIHFRNSVKFMDFLALLEIV